MDDDGRKFILRDKSGWSMGWEEVFVEDGSGDTHDSATDLGSSHGAEASTKEQASTAEAGMTSKIGNAALGELGLESDDR